MAIIFYGCMSVPKPVPRQTYEGPRLTEEQEVVLYHHINFTNDLIIIDNIIYRHLRDDPTSYFAITPGIHHIDYYYNIYNRGWAIGKFSVDMKAGHTYVLKVVVDTNFRFPYSQPWEATVILSDMTGNVDVISKHFQKLMSWDELL